MRLPWQRRLFLLDEPPVQGRYGWPPANSMAGVLLAEERSTALIVLRGERGLGKSVALRQEYDALTAEGVPAAWLELKQCTTVESAQTRLRQALTRPSTEAGEWHVLLDGLDEGLNDLPQLDQLLDDVLATLPQEALEALRLRITCRSARWPARLEDALRQRWADPKIMAMAPLSRDDVALAAQAFEVTDTEDFLQAVRQQGLMALATHPVTLLQLLDSYKTHASLPRTAQDAYLQACLRLCTEHRRSTDRHQLQAERSPEHLLAVAARLAAALQFGPYTAVADTPAEEGATAADLRLSRLDGGYEPGHLDSQVPCTLWDLRQVTESGLLAPVGELRWVFAHDSYREFLTAHFLRMRAMQPEPQRQLLWIGDGDARHIIPAHQEVAAWRATSDPTLFADLLREAPLILLLADLPSMPAAARARTVDALFSALQQDDTLTLDHSLLHRLDHPDLPAQLKAHLTAASAPHLLYAALEIAWSCPHPELNDTLMTVAENLSYDRSLRTAALTGITMPASGQTIPRLIALTNDTSPEVVAAALDRLYPEHLPLADLFARFRDSDQDFEGVAERLRREIPERIDGTTVVEAVTWAQDALKADTTIPASCPLAVSLLARAVTLNEDTPTAGLVPLVSKAILHLVDNDENLLYDDPMQTALEDLADALGECPRTRREVTLHTLQHSDEDQLYTALSVIPHDAILPAADALHWMEHWDQLTTANADLASHAVRFAPPTNADAKTRGEAARQAHPTLAAATAFQWEIYPLQQQERAERLEAAAQKRRFDAAALNAAIEEVFTPGNAGDPLAAWSEVLHQLHRTPDGSPSRHNASLLSYASHAPSRPAADTVAGARLAQAAAQLLRQLPPLAAAALLNAGGDVRQAVELTAFALIPDPAALDVTPEHWAGWALALATAPAYGSSENNTHAAWLPLCIERAQDHLPPRLIDTLDRASIHTLRNLAGSLGGPPAYALRPTLRTWALRPERNPEQWYAVVDELAAAHDSQALTQLAQTLEADPRTQEADTPARQRWLLAAQSMPHHHSLAASWPALRRGLSDASVLQEYRSQLTRRDPDTWSFHRLDNDTLAELYTLLLDDDSLARLQRHPQPGIQPDDRLVDLLQHLPRLLASRATPSAATALRRLAQTHPGVPQLRVYARVTARAAADRDALPLEPEQLIRLATDTQTRLVRDARQLLDLVRESLSAMQEDLQGYNGTAVNLWNRDRSRFEANTRCWPCWEDDLSDAVASFLRRDIGGHRVVVNREVQVRRTGLPGLRTDLQIEAPSAAGTGQSTIRVVIEAKGCWNHELPTAARTQLRAYLSEPHTAGLLLVGYFDSTRWNAKRRGCPSTGHEIDDVRSQQVEQARSLVQDEQLLVAAHVLDCRLPSEDSDWRKAPDPSHESPNSR
ncbi:hypothetical protein [Streptomyces collinus]|uniref:hypothetical protein n=1 Tax=Streptomyces collinus TaxID=42684 RepID=UPI00381F7C3F